MNSSIDHEVLNALQYVVNYAYFAHENQLAFCIAKKNVICYFHPMFDNYQYRGQRGVFSAIKSQMETGSDFRHCFPRVL